MSSTTSPPEVASGPGRRLRYHAVLGLLATVLGASSIAAPFVVGVAAAPLIAVAALVCAACQAAEALYIRGRSGWLSALVDSGLLLLIGVLLFLQPILVFNAFAFLLGAMFAASGISRLLRAWKCRREKGWLSLIGAGAVNLALAVMLWAQWPVSGLLMVAMIVGFHIVTTGISMLMLPDVKGEAQVEAELASHPDRRLGLAPDPRIAQMRSGIVAAEDARWSIDLFWQVSLLIIFFAIHVGRMRVDWNLVGLFSPLVAVMGDAAVAVIVALAIVMPAQLLWRRLTRPVERWGWNWLLPRWQGEKLAGLRPRTIRFLLGRRLLLSERIVRGASSVQGVLHRALNLGLPVVAVLIAITPIWGFSWYFNSENWVTAVWERWAEHRTDTWRREMIEAVRADALARGVPEAELFAVHPPGLEGDFSFIVIGDTGEGDASQYSLKDQILDVGSRPEVKFLIVSSDVIYPAGAMVDYEPNFYMPFKGFQKPIYAIPGNHDWFDALEAFLANFCEPRAAGLSMAARVATDLGLTTTQSRQIEGLIKEAGRLRRQYGLQLGFQRGSFFEMHSGRFSLIAVDTGIQRSVDEEQEKWLRAALGRAKGKFKLVLLGHPLYAAGACQSRSIESFARIHELLRAHGVEIAMGGDTHDLEYYRETYEAGGQRRQMHHFVNGGGGAFLSIGTALSWPKARPESECAFYPRRDALVAKLSAQTPRWKQPLWFWVHRLQAWPSSPEGMAAAFDYNRAPFFQSFMEVKVEPSRNRVRLIAYGVSGPLRWRDLELIGSVVPAGKGADDPVEFVFPMGQ